MKKIENVEQALNLIEEAAIVQGEAFKEGNSKIANHNHDKIEEVVGFLRSQKKLSELSVFYKHPNDNLRLTAAAYLLPLYEKESIKVMKEIAKKEGVIAFDAKMTIQEWKKGKLSNFYTL